MVMSVLVGIININTTGMVTHHLINKHLKWLVVNQGILMSGLAYIDSHLLKVITKCMVVGHLHIKYLVTTHHRDHSQEVDTIMPHSNRFSHIPHKQQLNKVVSRHLQYQIMLFVLNPP